MVEPIIRSEGITEGERQVARLCEKSFFSLWSYPNLFKQKGSELCDNLIVFGNTVIIISEKTNEFKFDEENIEIVWKRWKKALEKSENQLKGAERWLKEHPERVFLDAKCEKKFPIAIPIENARFIKISVINGLNEVNKIRERACNGELKIPADMFIFTRDIENIIHTLDEYTFPILFKELDTAADFISYFVQKEELLQSGKCFPFFPEETDLLVMFLSNINKDGTEHCFFSDDFSKFDHIVIDNPEDPYPNFIKEELYLRKRDADKVSYVWDKLINNYCKSILERKLIGDSSFVDQLEVAQILASECRFSRRMLSENILHSIKTYTKSLIRRGTVMISFNQRDLAYLYLQIPKDEEETYEEYREKRNFFLLAYSMVFKKDNPQFNVVLGIGTEPPKFNSMLSEDFLLYRSDIQTPEEIEKANEIQEEFNILKKHKVTKVEHSDEYPQDTRLNDIKLTAKIGRNEPCPCRSGKKYKKCCGT